MDSNSAGELHDEALSDEIKLLASFVLAAAAVPRRLTLAEVDQILGLGISRSSHAVPSAPTGSTRR